MQKPVNEDLVLLAGQPADRREHLGAFADLGISFLAFRFEMTGDGLSITVVASSPGIHFDNMDRVLEPFFTTKSSGIGMGLSICHSIMKIHGGLLSVSSGQPYGSIFR